ncbi:TonB-dependent receptor [Halioxenophilus sp. WMMB6]|uniref:TonB-dependent receptor n=1 Tax=Halioxenophilus sp. WMMB6 TaxID=3073815 RepID=UPI00295E53C6|nr:TonB-dependent receptor [Halioxenophilus sp. WMMB6]
MKQTTIYSAIVLGSLIPTLVQAQAGAVLEEVIVTAQKREQSMQDVPAAVTAFGESQLEANGIGSLDGMNAMAPNVIVEPVGLFPQSAVFSIRGLSYFDIASEKDPTVGVVLDGVNQPRNLGTLMDMYDVQRIEVLRGPQGTLFGRNNIGGVLNVVTKNPGDEFGGDIRVTAGDYGRRELRAAVDVPIGENTGLRISGLKRKYDGHFENGVTGKDLGAEDVESIRVKLSHDFNDDLSMLLTVDDITERSEGNGVVNFSKPDSNLAQLGYPANNPNDPYTVYTDLKPIANLDTTGATLELNWELDSGTVTSITGWRKTDDETQTDFDGTTETMFHVHRTQEHKMWTQELRFASDFSGPVNFVGGYFHSYQDFDLTNDQAIYLPLFGVPVDMVVLGSTPGAQENVSDALFFQGDYDLNDKFTLTVGARYTDESKTFSNSFADELEKDWQNFSPMARVSYQWDEDINLYFGYTTGFRSGVFNARAGTATSIGPADEETVESWEAGIKSSLFDGLMRFNAALFYSTYSDMQLTFGRRAPGTDTFETVTDNAGQATIQGVESELSMLVTDNLSVQFILGYLDAQFDKFTADLEGNGTVTDNTHYDLPYAPRWTSTLQLTYDLPVSFGNFNFHGGATFTDRYLTTSLKDEDVFYRDALTVYNARITFSDPEEKYKVALYGKNLSDEHEKLNAFELGTNFMQAGSYMPPRSYGVEFTYSF